VAKHRGAIIVISGPSGSGKTTLVQRALAADPELVRSVSATTRSPRPGEVNGRNYWFLAREEFERRIAAGGFAEWAESFGNLYGTPAGPMRDALAAGRVLLLEIDVQGARQIRKAFPGAVFIFIKTPTFEVLAERLRARQTETPEQFEIRLARARQELAAADEYDHVVVNDRLDDAAGMLIDLIRQVKEERRAESD
jgi:guanylate kinase